MTDETEDTDEVLGTGNDARLKLFDSIADNADKVREHEMGGQDVEDETETDEKTTVEAQADETWVLKVNGQEKTLTKDEVIALAQKVDNADHYLDQAKKAAERFDQLALERRQPVVQELPSKEDVPNEDDLALARALQVGTEEEAVKAIRKLRAPAIQPDVVVAQALDKLNFQQAFNTFQETYKDISSDPNLMQLAIAKDAQLVQSGDRRSYSERYKAIGDEIRSWRGTPEKSFKEKEERKSATVTNIRTAGARATPVQEDESDESPSEIIAKMARARGQLA